MMVYHCSQCGYNHFIPEENLIPLEKPEWYEGVDYTHYFICPVEGGRVYVAYR
jgi:hypothetical protein